MTYISTSSRCSLKSVLFLIAFLLCTISAFAEDSVCRSKAGEIRVAYPELARRMKITGIVRLELQLSPSGSVRSSKVVGGNPVLVAAAQDAVKRVRFEGSDPCVIVMKFLD